jgi:hypothetical protein
VGDGSFDAVVVERVSGLVGGHLRLSGFDTTDCFTPQHKELIRKFGDRPMLWHYDDWSLCTAF